MSFSSYDSIISAYTSTTGRKIDFWKDSITAVAGYLYTLWKGTGVPGAGSNPTTIPNGDTPNSGTAGALTFSALPNTNDAWALYFEGVSTSAGSLILIDRLWHGGNVNLNSASLQNIASAIVRYTNGYGVGAMLEITTLAGTTARTATIKYTNTADVSGRTGTATVVASSPVNRCYTFRLQSGDAGIKSIQSIQMSGTMGAGVATLVMYKEIAATSYLANLASGKDLIRQTQGMSELQFGNIVATSPCLSLMVLCSTTATGNLRGSLTFAQEA